MADTEPNGVDVWLIKWAISNCHTLARRRIKAGSTDSDWWGHVLRLCEKAGAKSLGVLRVGECDALGQAATDAEALAAKDAELRKRSDVTTAQTIALTKLGDEYANEFNRAESLQASLTAERQKVRELREYLDNEIAVAIKCDEQAANTADPNWFRGKAEGYAWAVKRMDALGLTGDATEGQG